MAVTLGLSMRRLKAGLACQMLTICQIGAAASLARLRSSTG